MSSRNLRRFFTLVCTIAVLALPATASAQVDPSFTGWTTVETTDHAGWGPSWTYAWQWSTRAERWNASWRYDGERVWVQPFAKQWMWTWSAPRGWLAMQTSQLRAPATSSASIEAEGNVIVGPMCPVEPCNITTQPVVRLTFTLRESRVPVAAALRSVVYTSNDGHYSTRLAADATYAVTANYGINWRELITTPATGSFAHDFSIDTGIR